jgi:hypothetical protein
MFPANRRKLKAFFANQNYSVWPLAGLSLANRSLATCLSIMDH